VHENSSTDLPAVGGKVCRGVARASIAGCVAASAVVVLGVGYFAVAGSRMAFLRGATLVLDASPASYELPTSSNVTVEPLAVVTSIPAPPMDTPWWSPVAIVDPDLLVEYTLRQGGGNCASKSRGLGWWLHGRGVPYRLVYLLSDPGIRHGEGHTMVEAAWQQDEGTVVALLDPLAAGVPIADGVPLDSKRLIQDRGGPGVTYWPDRPELDSPSFRPLQFPPVDTVSSVSFVAFSPGTEVSAHLHFMKGLSAFTPDSFASRVAGMSASLFLGIYPRTYVPPEESVHVSGILRADMWAARSVVWGARAALGLSLLAAAAWVCGKRASRRTAFSTSVAIRS